MMFTPQTRGVFEHGTFQKRLTTNRKITRVQRANTLTTKQYFQRFCPIWLALVIDRFTKMWPFITSLPTIFALLLFATGIESDCSSSNWECRNGNCITRSYLCDGGPDCGDGSDEIHCSCTSGPNCYVPPLLLCPMNEFRCNSGACIPKTWECDGDFDCVDLSDEHPNCERVLCSGLQFTCDNGFCIDGRLKCNGMNDCGDNSDEVICKIIPANALANMPTECGNHFQCKDGHCMDYQLVCDNIQHCLDGSDEGGLCQSSCFGNSDICDHGHRSTPSGCLCTCSNGYRLAGDGMTCVDSLECTRDPPVCSQLCKEERGSYSCGCYKEFRMRNDNTTCKSRGNPSSIYFAVKNEIRQFIPSQRTLKIIHMEVSGDITALEVNVKEDMLYYAVQNMSNLYCLRAQNASKKFISNVAGARNLAYDWISENIYYVTEHLIDEGYENESSEDMPNWLQVCNFNERRCANIAKYDAKISTLSVDPINKYIFYAVIDGDQCNIYRSSLDGSYSRVIAICTNISSIAADYRRRQLYIANETSIIRLEYDANLEGSHRLVTIINTEKNVIGLNIFEDNIYFLSDWGSTMLRCRLYGDLRRCTSFRLSANSTDLFVIAQTSRQTPGRNPCVNYNCSHLCIPNDTGASCLCQNGNIVDENDDCSEKL